MKVLFTVQEITYKTSEHWMMAQKALLFGDSDNFEKIISCNKPGEAKELGRQVSGYDDDVWNNIKFEIVKLGNIHKFNQNPGLADFLLKTENRILVETSPIDTVWGIGLSQDDREIDNIYAWRGQNLLGFALMEVRDFFKNFGLFKHLDNSIQPPWQKYPRTDSADLFWRMGKGENYLLEFNIYFSALNDHDKIVYKLTNPQPYDWSGFYD